MHQEVDFIPLNIAVLTLSDTRSAATDTSGQALADLLVAAGHQLAARELCPDDVYISRAIVARWIADDAIDVVNHNGYIGRIAAALHSGSDRRFGRAARTKPCADTARSGRYTGAENALSRLRTARPRPDRPGR